MGRDGRAPRRAGADRGGLEALPVEDAESAGALDAAVAEVRAFLHASAAVEVQGVVDRGAGTEPALVRCVRAGAIEVVDAGRRLRLPHGARLSVPDPPLPDVQPVAGVQVDPADGRVAAPLGAVHALVDGVQALAARLGGRSVAMALVETDREEAPLGVVARPGEPPVLTIGDDQFALPDA